MAKIQKPPTGSTQIVQEQKQKVSKRQSLHRLASLIEQSMEGLSNAEKDRRVKQFGKRVSRAVDRANAG